MSKLAANRVFGKVHAGMRTISKPERDSRAGASLYVAVSTRTS